MILAPISIGELVDKITILEIKQTKTTDVDKLNNIDRELRLLADLYNSLHVDVAELKQKLYGINSDLWIVEDSKRQCERLQQFDSDFIQLARRVYILNDQRAEVKRQINLISKSGIVEEKIY